MEVRIQLKEILNKLLNRNRLVENPQPTHTLKNQILSAQQAQSRCEAILNYWLDIELFDLPECPFQTGSNILSKEAESFKSVIEQQIIDQAIHQSDYLTEDSRLVVMFQCHMAGYIAVDSERHPNFIIPRTYLVSHSFVPVWDAENAVMKWSLSIDDKDLIINLSTLRTIYKKCRPSTAHNMRLSEWIATAVNEIENQFKLLFSDPENQDLLSTETLQSNIKKMNRELAKRFWPEALAQDFMLQHAQAIETQFATDQPVRTSNNELTFRWRYGFYPEGNESQQLGPFFVKDLESCLTQLLEHGIDGLSVPLQKYLLGQDQQTLVPEAVNHGNFFLPLTQKIALGRWPSDPEYGLSLLQTVAVNVVKEQQQNPVVAVNGPPGTGKTTLLKDIIADRVVHRTQQLLKYEQNKDWLEQAELLDQIMQHSIIVASSNNKAVENISKELPASSNISEVFEPKLQHFKQVCKAGEWGTFCAVLGNASNRKEFKSILKKLSQHLRYVNDIYKLNPLLNKLKKTTDLTGRAEVFTQHVELWNTQQQINMMLNDFKQCSNFDKHKDFFVPFAEALTKIADGQLEVEQLNEYFKALTVTDWDQVIAALEAIKKQWFAKKQYLVHHTEKLQHAKQEFNAQITALNHCLGAADQFILNESNLQKWQLDTNQHLTQVEAYDLSPDQEQVERERELQQKSPFSSKGLNQARSDLFAAALRLNQAILESKAQSFAKYWDDLEALLDGTLESNEQPAYHQRLWSILFLFFPVLSTSLSSVENQFKLMQQVEGFGLALLDEAGQAVNYHVVGLLQRCKQVVFVGDPIQLEPVVNIAYQIDKSIAEEYLPLSTTYAQQKWGDAYLVSNSSAQSIADRAGNYYAEIGERKVGLPLLVHRRCLEPMFSIANRIAYDHKMVSATSAKIVAEIDFLPSGWLHVEEQASKVSGNGYANRAEAETAMQLIEYLAQNYPQMLKGGVFIITPFTSMKREIVSAWKDRLSDVKNHSWMLGALGERSLTVKLEDFSRNHIGTVHTFQGKEASTVILCTAASAIRKKEGGIKWVNSKPNLLNVAVTRAKAHLFIVGNQRDWASGSLSTELQQGAMQHYQNFEQLKQQAAIRYEQIEDLATQRNNQPQSTAKSKFYFGA